MKPRFHPFYYTHTDPTSTLALQAPSPPGPILSGDLPSTDLVLSPPGIDNRRGATSAADFLQLTERRAAKVKKADFDILDFAEIKVGHEAKTYLADIYKPPHAYQRVFMKWALTLKTARSWKQTYDNLKALGIGVPDAMEIYEFDTDDFPFYGEVEFEPAPQEYMTVATDLTEMGRKYVLSINNPSVSAPNGRWKWLPSHRRLVSDIPTQRLKELNDQLIDWCFKASGFNPLGIKLRLHLNSYGAIIDPIDKENVDVKLIDYGVDVKTMPPETNKTDLLHKNLDTLGRFFAYMFGYILQIPEIQGVDANKITLYRQGWENSIG